MSDQPPSAPTEAIHYFVDEAGDTTLFDRRGRCMLGRSGCSTFFIMGKLDVEDVAALGRDLNALRQELLADPYFRDVPSMRPTERKTALVFHAKDDTAEVRWQVFKTLLRHDVRFYAVVRDKRALLSEVRSRNMSDATYHYRGELLYDALIAELFAGFRRAADHTHICFARRGTRERSVALQAALDHAGQRFRQNYGFLRPGQSHVRFSNPSEEAGLQAVDYFLWALQRHYERAESRFVKLIWDRTMEVQDLDAIDGDKRGACFGPKRHLCP